MNRRGIPLLDKDKNKIFDTETRTEGCVDPSFIAKHKLGIDTTPEEFVSLFLQFGKNQHGSKEFISFELLTMWTNLKATLAGAGKGGTYYTVFTPFSVEEIRHHIGLYIFHGLSPSPMIVQV